MSKDDLLFLTVDSWIVVIQHLTGKYELLPTASRFELYSGYIITLIELILLLLLMIILLII